MHAAARLLQSRSASMFGALATGKKLRVWWKRDLLPTTPFTLLIEGAVSTPKIAGEQGAKGAFKREKETEAFNLPKASFTRHGFTPEPPALFLAGYAMNPTDPAVKKYIVVRVSDTAVQSHFYVEAELA